MGRPMTPMNGKIENFIRMEARGEGREAILREVFKLDPATATENQIHSADCSMSRWRKRPDYKPIWDDELSIVVRRHVPGAVKRVNAQVNNENDWVANKASNDILNLAARIGVIKNEETAVKVEVSGLPDLGAPDE